MPRTPFLTAGLAVVALNLSAVASQLENATSAFVRAHADSPVQWQPWGEAAWERARAEQKPIYVVVGSLTQELARAMREQSFAREETAAILNDSFIPVLVDRDEHPDLAAFLQTYVRTVKQMQGWPLNVWLTPGLKPFEGASYLPPTDEWGKEGFPNALQRVLDAWRTDPEAQRTKAVDDLAVLAAAVPSAPPELVDAGAVNGLLAEATAAWLATYDATNGGFGDPPRRLEPELLRFLLKCDDADARDAAGATLRAMATSPLRDPLDGGFFRSTIDAAWREPTLQKTLADQARVALAYGDASMRDVAAQAMKYARSLGSPETGFATAEDGTADASMPSFFWTAAEVRTVLGDAAADGMLKLLGVSEAGNLTPDGYPGIDLAGKNLPRWTTAPFDGAADSLEKLRLARARRPQPARVGPASSGVHGLLLSALVRIEGAGLPAAAGLASFVREKLIQPDGALRAGPGWSTPAAPSDYALVADGLLTYAAGVHDEAARNDALALLHKMDTLFWDPSTGRYAAAALPLPPGVGVRVTAPAPDPGDLPSAEAAVLWTLATHGVGDPEKRAQLAAAIAADMRDAALPARGDQLLALQAWVSTQQ